MKQLSVNNVLAFAKASLPGALAFAVLLACGGDDDSADGVSGETSQDELALMVLSPAELDEQYAHLTIDPESGTWDREGILYPVTSKSELVEAGWIDGYRLQWIDPSSFFATEPRVIAFLSSVLLFEDADLASEYLAGKLEAQSKEQGEEVDDQVTLVDASSSEVGGPGDEAVEVSQSLAFGELEVQARLVIFRAGPLLAFVGILRNDREDVSGDLADLAEVFDDRIEGVLAGEVSGTPVSIPTESVESDGEATTVLPPVGSPDLAQFAITPDDLPGDAGIEREGYASEDDDLSFERELDLPSGTQLGESELIGLEHSIELRDVAQADAFVNGFVNLMIGDGAVEFVGPLLEDRGITFSDLETHEVPLDQFGDESAAVAASFDTTLGRFEFLFILLRVDGLVTLLTITGAPGAELDISDFDDLLGTLARRMESGCASEPCVAS